MVLSIWFPFLYFLQLHVTNHSKVLNEKNVKKGKIRAWMFIWERYCKIAQGFQDVAQTLSDISVSVIWDSRDYVKNFV